MSKLEPFDIQKLAENGLRRGHTTGTCATAAVKAALLHLCFGETVDEVAVTLPDERHFLKVPIKHVCKVDEKTARAEVIKHAGDDPDQTDGATIFAEVRENGEKQLRFLAGAGVGIVTAPGIRVGVGEPAINPVPREMIALAVSEILHELPNPGFDLIIGCENGAQIAKKTFNPRLGIVGGISILGTTGIVEPMSLAAYQASIEVYIRVALADEAPAVAYLPGNLGISFAREQLKLEKRRVVHISNWIGFALEATERTLLDERRSLPQLWVLGHPGKLAKVLAGYWDTHSNKSPIAINSLVEAGQESDLPAETIRLIADCPSVEAVIQQLDGTSAEVLWSAVSKKIAAVLKSRVTSIDQIEVRLFSMHGQLLWR